MEWPTADTSAASNSSALAAISSIPQEAGVLVLFSQADAVSHTIADLRLSSGIKFFDVSGAEPNSRE